MTSSQPSRRTRLSNVVRPVKHLARDTINRAVLPFGWTLMPFDPEFANRLHSGTTPLPPEAAELRRDHPRLVELERQYAALDWPVRQSAQWSQEVVDQTVDLQHFRGDTAYVWHYRESRRVSELKFFVHLEHLRSRDAGDLIAKLGEDGAFGCWTYEFPDRPPFSRDLLDAVNELLFLDAQLGVLRQDGLRVLDVGAGYGRLAHRFLTANPSVADYCCVDAIAASTFLCEWHLGYRGLLPPARVVPLPDVPALEPGSFDLACNIHSWSECTHAAVSWWADQLARLQVPRIFLVPNEREGFQTSELDGTSRDYLSVLERAGYALVVDEPALPDPAVRELLNLHDRHCLLELR